MSEMRPKLITKEMAKEFSESMVRFHVGRIHNELVGRGISEEETKNYVASILNLGAAEALRR